jgi:hypothetical protein
MGLVFLSAKTGTSRQCPELELELELIQTRMTQKPVLWVEVGKKVLGGFANCASLCLLDMTRNAPHFWTFSLGAWSASYTIPHAK